MSLVCLLLLLTAVPYVAASTGVLYEAIRSPEPISLPEQPAISPQLADLLTRLLDKNPATRMTLDEVGAAPLVAPALRHALLLLLVLFEMVQRKLNTPCKHAHDQRTCFYGGKRLKPQAAARGSFTWKPHTSLAGIVHKTLA